MKFDHYFDIKLILCRNKPTQKGVKVKNYQFFNI